MSAHKKNEKIFIFDTTLRDGEQVPGCQLSKDKKIEIALQLEALGVDIIEAGFPISSPGDFDSVVAISEHVKDSVICALSRSIKKDIEVAADALKKARRGRIHTGIGVSDMHLKYKFNITQDEAIERAVTAVKHAKKFVEDVEFYAEDSGRAENIFLAKIIEAVIKAGATVVNIPDTNGYCLPEMYAEKIAFLKENVRGIDNAVISVHCHNDLGLATANSLAGVFVGARQIECAINGVGERAGNTSLEEVVMAIKVHKQSLNYFTDIDTTKISATSKLVSNLMNMPVQPNKAIVGRNAFAHSSGIHQDGFLKKKENYEIMDPESIGIASSEIILTARSGRHALKHRLEVIGFNFEKEQVNEIYKEFLMLADEKGKVDDKDLFGLIKRMNLVEA